MAKLTPQFYNNNPNLKASGVKTEFTAFQLEEYIKCADDPIYFLENYAKIVSLDEGVINFVPFEYQKRFIKAVHENRLVCARMARQLGKSTICAGYIAWFILFNSNQKAAVLANKQAIAQEIFSRVKFIIENVPIWLQKGIRKWAETRIKFDNGSSCFCAATSPSAVRGDSISLILLDEFAHMNPKLADSFIASVFPTISSSKKAKMMIVSTPNGLNHYYKIWDGAVKGTNNFIPVDGKWYENPNRDEAWAKAELKALGAVRYAQEVSCEFSASSYSLISGTKLQNIVTMQPIFSHENMHAYFEPIKDHSYVCAVDTSRGQHLDYSAFVMIDITELPYKVVAVFKDNQISPMSYPYLIYNVCKKYNDAHILIEINDIGGQVADALFYELEYENMYFTYKDEVAEGLGYPGVRTTKRVKAIGCSTLKDFIENDQLEINSEEILKELGVFVQKGTSYAASDTAINDDLTACLFLFAYLTKQAIFKDLTNVNIREIISKRTEQYISDNMVPFGIIDNGMNEEAVAQFDIKAIDPIDQWMFS